MGLRAGLDWCGKSRLTGIRSPDRPARRQSLYRLSYQVHWIIVLYYNNIRTIYEGGSKRFRPDQPFKVTEIKQLRYVSIYIYIYIYAIFQYSLTIDVAIYPSQHFPLGAAFVCQAGNFWTHSRIYPHTHTYIKYTSVDARAHVTS